MQAFAITCICTVMSKMWMLLCGGTDHTQEQPIVAQLQESATSFRGRQSETGTKGVGYSSQPNAKDGAIFRPHKHSSNRNQQCHLKLEAPNSVYVPDSVRRTPGVHFMADELGI